MKLFLKWTFIVILSVILLITAAVLVVPKVAPAFGARPSGKSLERIEASPNYKDGIFVNQVKTEMNTSGGSFFSTFMKFLRGGKNRTPGKTIETAPFEKSAFAEADSLIRMTWFGHSTILLRIDGKNLLIDPVFSNHASPFGFMGPQAFPYTHKYSIDDLPEIDAVLISHDHYDHLDYETILKLRDRVDHFFVPLGLAAHLQHWGVDASKIKELDWWDESGFMGLTFACVPMRHFSGRGLSDRYCTLWAGWVIQSKDRSVIHTGDSGYGPHFKKIGERYGPFDLTMVECGQYNENWKQIHMMPEETVQAHFDLKGKFLLPIHWGRFNLALHSWTDPISRATAEANKKKADLITPIVGQTVSIHPPLPHRDWWSAFD